MRSVVATLLLTAALPALAGTPKASSELKTSEQTHKATLAFDGLLSTAWAEGEQGDGEGSWIELPLDRKLKVESVSIWPGNLSIGERSVREHGRPHTVTVSLVTDGDPIEVQARVLDPSEEGLYRLDVPIEGEAKAVRVTIDKAYSGGLHSDLYIAEIAVNFAKGELPDAAKTVVDWYGSDAGKEAAGKNAEEIAELVKKINEAEFGDRDSFSELTDRAGDGAPFARKKVTNVPYGFRASALPTDLEAVKALLTLKNANGIPALQRASMRSTGAMQKDLAKRVNMLAAHQDLVGGGSMSVKPWGQTGFAAGALQSFGEPIALGVDSYGGVYAADVGNHRVQRFNFQGIAEKAWGGDKGMTDTWFYTTREHYASGAAPGKTKGSFVNPVDLVVIPGKEADSVAVLDSAGRISIIGPSDTVEQVIETGSSRGAGPGAGGEGHIGYAKGKLVTLLGDEGYVHKLDGELVSTFSLDRTGTDMVVFKNGKIGLVQNQELVLYSTDGFRHGEILGDTVGEGFDFMAVNLDEKGKLWVVTEDGRAIKYKKPGVVDYEVTLTPYSLQVPRIAVYDDVVFVSHEDHITRVDALEAQGQQ